MGNFEHADEFRKALEDGDVVLLRRAHQQLFPHLQQPASEHDAKIVLHHARTQAISITFAKRAYSHRWLTERGLPSALPDDLKPKAERMYPRVARAVGIGARSQIEGLAPLLQKAMSDAVADCYADDRTESVFVRGRIQEARKRTIRSLMGAAYGRSA